jgi:hypothetical protein
MPAIVISFEPVVRARRVILGSFAALAVLAAPGLLRLQMDNSPEGFFVRDHAALEAFERLEDDFGRDRGLRLVIEGDELWTPAGLVELARLEAGLSAADGGLGGVSAAAGPWRHHRWHLAGWPPEDPEAFRRLVLSDPLDRNTGWVSANGEAVTLIVGLFRLPSQRRATTVEAIYERLDALESATAGSAEGSRLSAYAVGLPIVSYTVDRGQARVIRIILPLLVLVAAALLAVLFRTLSGVLAPLALVAVTQVVVFGLMGYAGERIDFVTLLLAPLTFVIALATGVHVLAYQRRLLQKGVSPDAALLETYRVKAWPVLWAGMTTSVGFASLAASGVPSVQALGSWTAFGIAFMTLAALSFYPALLAVVGGGAAAPAPAAFDKGAQRAIRTLVRVAVTRPRMVYAAFGTVALLAALGLPRLAVDTSVLSYFASSHPLRAQIERLEETGLPPVTASLALEAGAQAGGFDDPESLRKLNALAEDLRAEPLVTGAVSAGDLVFDVARHLEPSLPAAGGEVGRLDAARAFMNDVPDLRDLLAAVLTDSGERTRVVLFTPMRGYSELEPVYRRAEAAAESAFPGARARVTGEYPLVLVAQRSLLRTMILSLLATFTVIAVTLRWLLGSASLTLRSLLPNLWPVLIVLGIMGWFAIPLDSTTVMVAAVALGLAVDDTLHTLGHLRLRAGEPHRESRPADRSHRAAVIESSLTEVAGGHVMTSMILCLGFLVPMLSELLPVVRFGMLSALAVAAALAADLLLVPALLAGASLRAVARLAPGGSRASTQEAG